MKKKYYTAIAALGEILVESRHDLEWKEMQIESKLQEIARLKERIAEIEVYVAKLEATCGKLRKKVNERSVPR